jgi:hypothetical protein
VLADQVSITSQNRNILGSAYSEVQVAAPYSNSFQSSAFRGVFLERVKCGLWVSQTEPHNLQCHKLYTTSCKRPVSAIMVDVLDLLKLPCRDTQNVIIPGRRDLWRLVTRVTKFGTVAPNIFSTITAFFFVRKQCISVHTHPAESATQQWYSQVTSELWVPGTELPHRLLSGMWNLKVVPRLFGKLVDP